MTWDTLQAATGGTEHSGFKRLRQTGEIVFLPQSINLLHFIFTSNVNAALTRILPLRL